MNFKCPTCSESFTSRSASCEDWRIPERSFGCPHCATFYSVETAKSDWGDSSIFCALSIVAVIEFVDTPLAGTVATPLVFGVGSFLYFYFKWKNRKQASWQLIPIGK